MTTTLRLLAAAALSSAALSSAALAQAAAPAPATPAPAAPAPAASTATTPAPAPAVQTLPDHVLGKEDAPVTIVEYASFTCSHCAAFHDENWPKLKADYIDTGKVKFIQRDVYFDQFGLWASVLANCGGADKYYPISDMLFDQQKTWLNANSAEQLSANLRKIGAAAGYSTEQMDACWADTGKVEQLVATFQKNATADQIEGTPTFIIGGEKVQNGPWPELKAKIDEKLAAAAPAAAPGTAPAAPASN